ncbi:MAG: hypothetical protein ACTSPQ_09900 [Candidatus Helarchaeota archaeon]
MKANSQVILKSLKVNSDFKKYSLSSKNTKEFTHMLDLIEKKIPKKNIERLDKLIEKIKSHAF